MNKIFNILKICLLFFQLPFEISNRSKKRTINKIKKMLVAENIV